MITREQLVECLRQANFSENQINSILQKRIKTLLQKGNMDNIKSILNTLEIYGVEKETIEGCLYVLATGKAEEIERIFEVLDEHGIGREAIEGCLYVLATGKAEEIEEIFAVLDEYGIGKETIEGCLSVLAMGKAKEIEKIFEVLDEHGIGRKTIEGCLTTLAMGKAKEIERIFEVLDEHGIGKETIEGCLKVLAMGKAGEIKKIFEVLDEHGIGKETIKGCLSVLTRGKAEEIERIFEVLDEHGIGKETIEGCLSVLIKGKAEEIERIFEVLDEHGIGIKTIEGCLSVLSLKNARDLNRVLTVLEQNNVDKAVMEQQYMSILNSGIDVEDIFKGRGENQFGNTYFKIIRMYMRLTQMYEKYYTRKQIEQFCKKKDISITEFLENVVLYPNNEKLGPVLYELLKRNRKLYIGKPIAMSHDYLERHGSEIVEVSKIVARKFASRYNMSDIQELESIALEIMINRCGGIANNFSHNPDVLYGSMFNYTLKTMKGHIGKQTISLTVVDPKDGTRKEQEVKSEDIVFEDTEVQNINYKRLGLTNAENDVIQCMVSLVEQGEAFQLNQRVAETLGIELEDVEDLLSTIRQKFIDNKIVRSNRRGCIEWTP